MKSYIDLFELKLRLQRVDEELCRVQKKMYHDWAQQKRSCKTEEDMAYFEASEDDYRDRLEQIKLQKKDNLKKLKAVERCLVRDGSLLETELEYRISVGDMEDIEEIAWDEVPASPYRELETVAVSEENISVVSETVADEIVEAGVIAASEVEAVGEMDIFAEVTEVAVKNADDINGIHDSGTGMSGKSDLRKKAEIALNTMTKLRRDEEVSLTILSKICKTLNADFGDIVEYVPDAEIWDLYDENRELLGRDHVRGEQLPIDGYHLVVHVWIRNSKGEYLISQRSANRPTYPLMWECVGGSVVKGEDSILGAIREAKEEVGVDLETEKGQVLFTKTRKIIDGKIFNDIMDVWLFEYDGEVDLGNATTDEVAQVTWMNREQIKELFEHNMFVETLRYFFTEVDK